MFSAARIVLKDGVVVVEDGEVRDWRAGKTLILAPPYDAAMQRRSNVYLEERFGAVPGSFAVPQEAFARPIFQVEPCLS